MKTKLIAPCGMNCNLCMSYLMDKNKCPGCRYIGEKTESESTKKYSKKCIIKNCEVIKKNNWKFCSTKCDKFTCRRLKILDERYRNKYKTSFVKNLKDIEENGIRIFLQKQKKKYIKGDKICCIHNKKYYVDKNS